MAVSASHRKSMSYIQLAMAQRKAIANMARKAYSASLNINQSWHSAGQPANQLKYGQYING